MNNNIQNSLQNQLNNDLNILNFLSPIIEEIEEKIEEIEEKIEKTIKDPIIEKIEKTIKEITTKVSSFFDPLKSRDSSFPDFSIPLSTSYKKHYKEIKKVMEVFSEKKMKRLAAVCASLLGKIQTQNIQQQNIEQKESPVSQKLKVIFIATQMFEKRCKSYKPFKQPFTYILDQFLPLSDIKEISLYIINRVDKTKAIETSIADVIFNASFKWIEKDDRLNLLDLKTIIKYCRIHGKELKSLNLKGIKEDINADIKEIANYCLSLDKLNLGSTNITDLIKLEKLVKIKELDLSECQNLSEKEFSKIKVLFTHLTCLNLSKTLINTLEGLELVKLEELNLSSCYKIPKKAFSKIPDNFPNLKVLNLSETLIERVKGLEKLSQLKVLDLSISVIPTEEFLNFNPPSHLQILNLEDSEINNLKTFKNLFYLKSLNLSSCFQMTSFKEIEGVLPQLEELDISYCSRLSKEAFFQIAEKFPNLEKLNVSGTLIESLKGLTGLLQLKELNLSNCEKLSFQEEIFTDKKSFLNLKVLDLSFTTDPNFKNLEYAPHLKILNIKYSKIFALEKAAFIIKEKCPLLETLNLTGTTFNSLKGLEELSSLKKLILIGCLNISKKEMMLIRKKCPDLQIITH